MTYMVATLRAVTTDTPESVFHIIIDESDVARASGFGSLRELTRRLPEELQEITITSVKNHPYEGHLQAYFAGDKTVLDNIPRDQTGTAFQQRVWHTIGSVPYGQTISYKQLAERSGNPAAVRAAGTICGLNRLILLIPCHRVLKSDGGIGNYLYGAEIKTSLLRREGALGA